VETDRHFLPNRRPDVLPKAIEDEIIRFIDPEHVPRWLRTPNELFGGATPQELIDRGQADRIIGAIERLKAGGGT
jgi:hypothetical protein